MTNLPTAAPLRAATVTAAAACALLLASCSSGSGQPQSQGTEETSSTPLAGMAPCATLTEQQKKQLDITEPGKISRYDEQTCEWVSRGFDISVYEDKSLEKIRFSDADSKKKTEMSGHDSLLVKYDDGACSLAFAVTENSSVSVNSTADTPGDTATACELVQKAAPMVEQNIPES
ncbi:DUF3558 family protein [Actinopolyspora saharensis]|uniref:DUF3558 domain-containing protein n=1 Tax=Actinopolyspora saharensis TaxID=995062 RepID=A0A1H1E2V9_9ACTN|nr:DUF3558 family protein [Actinopolyspora saharensis]SDQ82940.1 Protein of unknown function [Actinopolyspora saharensis]